MLNKEQLLEAKKCITQMDLSNGGCVKCPNYKEECISYGQDVVSTALKYNEMIESILKVIGPILRDEDICPSCCSPWWRDHKTDCELKKWFVEASSIIK